MSAKLAKWIATTQCPECGVVGQLRPILWGMPTQEAFESGDWVIGGCMPGSADHGCLTCNWEGNFSRDGKLQDSSDRDKPVNPWSI